MCLKFQLTTKSTLQTVDNRDMLRVVPRNLPHDPRPPFNRESGSLDTLRPRKLIPVENLPPSRSERNSGPAEAPDVPHWLSLAGVRPPGESPTRVYRVG